MREPKEYDAPRAYGRIPGGQRDAKYAYNHVVCPEMLLWLIEAAGVREDLLEAARTACETRTSLMRKSGVIRRNVPWPEVYDVLWGSGRAVPKPTLLERLLKRKPTQAKEGGKAPDATG